MNLQVFNIHQPWQLILVSYFLEDYPNFSKGNVENTSVKLLSLQLLWMLLSILSTNKIILQYSHCSMTVYRWVSVSTLFLPPYYLETYVPIQFRKIYYFAFAGFCRYSLCFSAKGTWLSLMEWQFSEMKTSTISKKKSFLMLLEMISKRLFPPYMNSMEMSTTPLILKFWKIVKTWFQFGQTRPKVLK